MNCPFCSSINTHKRGFQKGKQRYRCMKCGKWFNESSYQTNNSIVPKKAKILLLDIETAPMEVYVWGLYKQRIPHTNIIKEWNIICFSAKWLNDSKYIGDCQTPHEAKRRYDKRILQKVWALLDEADIVVGHNVSSAISL